MIKDVTGKTHLIYPFRHLHTAASRAQVLKWELFELSREAKGQCHNPYAGLRAKQKETLVQAGLIGTGGEVKRQKLVLFGFRGGGPVWKLGLLAPFTDTWTYSTLLKDAGISSMK
jgi:hypothetical protein